MDNGRCRVQMSSEHYLDIKGKIVSKEEGEKRKQIEENYSLIDGKLVAKEKIIPQKAPLAIVSKDPSEEPNKFYQMLATNSGFIQGLTSTVSGAGQKPTRFNDIQAYLMDCNHKFLWMDKTRQFGFSFVLAARALAEAMINLKHTSIFVSYNEEESKEKIVYARELYDSLPSKYRLSRKLKYDNKTSLVFEKSGKNSAETRILSYPQRIIRGKGGDVHVRFDEAAHCIHIRKIYTSALPVLSRGECSLWIGSSPAGKGDLFYEVGVNQDNNYRHYVRMHVHWWDVPEFCTNVAVAREEARDMITDERVEKFATDHLKEIRGSMILEDFQQEYECAYLDESYSYYPWDLIMGCVPILNIDGKENPDYDAPGGDLSTNDKLRSGSGIDFYTDFDEFIGAVRSGIIRGPFLMGFDVGRSSDASEITFMEETNEGHQLVRCIIAMKHMRLPDQRRRTIEMLEILRKSAKVLKFGIDDNGLGRNIAEDIEDFAYELVARLPFNSNAWKEEASKKFKYRMELKGISLPTNRALLNQIHSIKRILLPGGNWRFDAEKAVKHHGDKFWSVLAASEVGRSSIQPAQSILHIDQRLLEKKGQSQRKRILPVGVATPKIMNDSRYDPYGSLAVKSFHNNLPTPRYPSIKAPSTMPLEEDMVHIL